MLNSKLSKGIVAVSAITLLAGGSLAAQAASSQAGGNMAGTGIFAGWKGKMSFHGDKGVQPELTDEQKAEFEAKRTERQEEMAAHRAEVKAALEAGDYNRWAAAVGTDSPVAQKVTADNFSRFVEAYKLRAQADQILEDIGFEAGGGMGLHMGRVF